MFNLGLSEVVLIAVIALIFIGPKQLPEIARALGKTLNELKRASEDLTKSITNPKNFTESHEVKHQQQVNPNNTISDEASSHASSSSNSEDSMPTDSDPEQKKDSQST